LRTDKERFDAAYELLTAQETPTPDYMQNLLDNTDAIRLLTQRDSSIRRQGNDVAHRLVDAPLLREIVARSIKNHEDREGMLGILEFATKSPLI